MNSKITKLESTSTAIHPTPIRWVGGKYRLRETLRSLTSGADAARLVDPFIGGGSTLSIFGQSSFIAGDANVELVNFFEVAKDSPQLIIDGLKKLPDTKETFLSQRTYKPRTEVNRAVRFIYLNRTAYFGMYRVNKAGGFNVPYGGGGRLNVSDLEESLSALSTRLKQGDVLAQDFETTLESARVGDLVFLDPPYSAVGETTFARYGANPFGSAEHVKLATRAAELAEQKIAVVATLPASAPILKNFEGWRVASLSYSRAIPRGEVVVFRNCGLTHETTWTLGSDQDRIILELAENSK